MKRIQDDNLTLLQSIGKTPSLKQLPNNKVSGVITNGPHILSVLIDIPPSS